MRMIDGRVVAVVVSCIAVVGVQQWRQLDVVSAQPATIEPVDFHRDVRPVLAQACFACHGPAEATRQAELRLDTDEFIGAMVIPGDADASPLFQRLTTDEPIGRMPPVSSGRSLTAGQISLVRQWIDEGAHWGAELQATGSQVVAAAARVIDFSREVRPLLAENCFSCHGPDEGSRQAGLRLDIPAGIVADRGRFGDAVVAVGSADDSVLIHRVSADEATTRMPRGGEALTDAEIETLRLWIDQGAEWESHWAFTAPERPTVPVVADTEWPRSPIDHFVLDRLEREGLTPSEEADRATLLRRATLDLTGVPPTPAELADFLNDDSADAYEMVVDRLLASPRYGERMAVEWLDAARYADTNGYQTDGERSMWRWRDWVIDAYNANMPFDQFTIEQLAGDMLPDATTDQRVATAFNRNHSQNSEGGIVPEEFLAEYGVDRVSTTATVWMGLTLGCARCHDHKFDPISQKEFYEVMANFNNIPERGKGFKYVNSPPLVTAPTDEQQEEVDALDEQLAEARAALVALDDDVAAARRDWEASLGGAGGVNWALRDGLLVHHAFEGDIAGTQTTADIPAVLEEGLPQFVPGRIGMAAGFDGQRFINAGASPDVSYDDAFSFAVWIYPTAKDGVILSRASGGDQGEVGWGLYLEDGKVLYNMSTRVLDDGVAAEMVEPVALNQWQHLVATYDGSRTPTGIRIYVDGVDQELTALNDLVGNRLNVSRFPLRIGASGSDKPRFQGRIDELRIYEGVLTSAEASVAATAWSLSDIAELAPEQRTSAQRDKLRMAFLDQYASPEIQTAVRRVVDLERDRDVLWQRLPTVMVMEELEDRRPTYRLNRGSYDNPAEEVFPGVPAVLPPLPEGVEANRLSFARWLVEPDHPLTARVTVNRFWQMYFGTGLVKTAENFGTQGEYPSHPELLDWLATTFIDTGWDMKALQRAIVTSATYRQASHMMPAEHESDPENRLLARGPRLRLPAPVIRDQALAMAGLLVEKVGGPSVKPYQPDGLWADMVEGGYGDYVEAEGDDLYRRSLYTFWKRTLGPPTMMTFDSSTRETCIVRTGRTNTPLQALNLMNDVTYVEAARRLAERVMTEAGPTPSDRIGYAYLLATAHRPPPAAESILIDGYQRHLERYQANRAAAVELVNQGESPRDETLDVAELASYTLVANLILNFDGTITKE
ncbi:MAG: DUF1553 domain-containing protein [Acidobacteriota bacterium]|nr:DUF1553 domain-containing protein [Acidobacteriota bacterium]